MPDAFSQNQSPIQNSVAQSLPDGGLDGGVDAGTDAGTDEGPEKLDQTIMFGALDTKIYLDAPFNLTATASSGLTVTYAYSNPSAAMMSGSTVTIISAGATTITASQAGSANYYAAPDVHQTLTVNKAAAVVTISDLNQIYDRTPKSALVKQIVANVLDEPLFHTVLPRRPESGLLWFYANGFESIWNSFPIFPVPVHDHVFWSCVIRKCFPETLDDPFRRRPVSNIEMNDLPPGMGDNKEDEQIFKYSGKDREEVHACQDILVVPEKGFPAQDFLRVMRSPWHVPTNCAFVQVEAELEQLPVNPGRTPTVLEDHLTDEMADPIGSEFKRSLQ